MNLKNVKWVELFESRVENIRVIDRINTTNLEDLLITGSQEHMVGRYWEELDSALSTLLNRMATDPPRNLNFYLTSNNTGFQLKKLLPNFTSDERVIINKSLVERSMAGRKESMLRGSGKRSGRSYPIRGYR